MGLQGRDETSHGDMPAWKRRAGGVLAIGGGVTGLAVSFASAAGFSGLISYVAVLFCVGVYAFGIWAGVQLLENRLGGPAQFARYLWFQVPVIQTDVVSYFLSSFASLSLIYRGGLDFEFVGTSISGWAITLFRPQQQFGLGINLFPILLLFVLRIPRRGKRGSR